MTSTFATVDPGSHATGIAIFKDQKLAAWTVITAPGNLPACERIAIIIQGIEDYIASHPQASEADTFVCEKMTALDRFRPAPELATTARAIRRWAKGTNKKNRRAWKEYNPSTVLASARVRGLTEQKTTRKEHIRLGVTMLYHDALEKTGPEEGQTPDAQDIYDAIAVGHYHIVNSFTETLGKH